MEGNTSDRDILITRLFGCITNVEKDETNNVVTAQAIYVRYFTDDDDHEYDGVVRNFVTIQFKDGIFVHITKS